MLDSFQSFFQQLTDHRPQQYSLEDHPDFPIAEFQSNQTRYTEMEKWYSGEILDETTYEDGKEVELYPLKFNPLKSAVEKHTHFLFGEVKQDDRPLVYPRALARDDSDAERQIAKEAEDLLYQVWWENNGRALQWENGALSQVYGGCVFKVSYDSLIDPLHSLPIRIESVHPKCFVGLPFAQDMWRLREAWVVTPITVGEAAKMGVAVKEDQGTPWLVEHWTEAAYSADINGEPVRRQDKQGDWRPVSGANIFGFVPLVYIPHIRVGTFYGENIIDVATGVIREINLRLADYGDAVNADAHQYVATRNTNGQPTIQYLAPGLKAINLNSSLNITGAAQEPDIIEVRKAAASVAMGELVEVLYELLRRLLYLPTVVDGEDEGSQRSGLTLAMRMISLTAHTDTERIFWSAGLDRLNRMILRICLEKGLGGIGVRHATLRLKQEWSPVLPRDREMIVNEAVSLMSAKLGSPERLLALLGVDDTEEEKQLILDFYKEVSKIEAKARPPAPQGQAGASRQAATPQQPSEST